MSDQRINKLPKWAQEYFYNSRRELLRATAMRYTEIVKPDVPIPESSSRNLSKGWRVWAWNGGWRVEKACSSSVSNGSGWERTNSQQPVRLFSSRLLALRAVRALYEREVANELVQIDEAILRETESPTEGPQ